MNNRIGKMVLTDVLVIGGGLAGTVAALNARVCGADVTIALKGKLGYCGNSSGATGGFAAATGEDDDSTIFAADILRGGFGISDPGMVQLVSTHAGNALKDLAGLGFEFPIRDGRLQGMPVPGHSQPRSVRYASGGMWHLMRGMRDRIQQAGIALFEDHRAIELLRSARGEIVGALLRDSETGELFVCRARAVVLATGGCGQLFPITTNKPDITGDGYALALSAGCALRDMEFIQFTPTAFAAPEQLRGLTMGGALLAQDNVRLLNRMGERFLEQYAPDALERAVRSVVSRAIHREIVEGRGTDDGGIFVDLTALTEQTIEQLKPGLLALCRRHGVDPTKVPLEAGNSAHHCIGGVAAGKSLSPRPGLYVAGETLGGLHGANRLSSNSLTEANVTGRLAGRSAARFAQCTSQARRDAVNLDDAVLRVPREGGVDIQPAAGDLKEIMGRCAGVERDEVGLREASGILQEMRRQHHEAGRGGPSDLDGWLDRRAMLLTAQSIVASARLRRESRGAHFRSDYPETNDAEWQGNIYLRLGCDGPEAEFRDLRQAA